MLATWKMLVQMKWKLTMTESDRANRANVSEKQIGVLQNYTNVFYVFF
jgi:hypothetical protein